MTLFIRYTRGVLVAFAALALTAGVTFAAREMAPAASVASAPANVTINVDDEADQDVDENQDQDVDQDVDENVDENQDEDVDQDEDVNDDGTTEEDGGDAKAEHPLNHGAYVSAAAHADTPEGFDNHGQWVSSIAKGTDGKTDQVAKQLAKTESKAAGHASSTKEKGAGRTKHAKR